MPKQSAEVIVRDGPSSQYCYIHSGDSGDLIYALAVMKRLGPGRIILARNVGVREAMTQSKAESLSHLLIAQPYITQVSFVNGEYKGNGIYQKNFDDFRYYMRSQRTLLIDAQFHRFNLAPDYTSWLTAPIQPIAQYVFNRTLRYQNPKVAYRWAQNLAKAKDRIFVGTKWEHRKFQQAFRNIPHYPTPTFLDLAAVIKGCEVFYGNQSSCFALAVGLGKQAVLEVYPPAPNCSIPIDRVTLLLD